MIDHFQTFSENTDDDRDPFRSWEDDESTGDAQRNQTGGPFQQISAVIKSVNDTLGNIKDTLMEHGKKFDILTRDAIEGSSLRKVLGDD